MKWTLIFSGLLLPAWALSQKAVMLHHNGIVTVFSSTTPFGDAYAAAQNGDTIYLPGGVYPTIALNKQVAIFGAGHYPDSTIVTGITQISGDISMLQGSDKTSIQGLKITGTLSFQDNTKIDSVWIGYCNIGYLYILYSNPNSTRCSGVNVSHNVIGGLYAAQTSGARIFNNIIGTLRYCNSSTWVRNNRISNLNECTYSLFENNTIQNFSWGNDFNTYRNNIFSVAQQVDNSTWVNNYFSVDFNNLFFTATDWFNYSDNYHLKNPGSYLGTDGQQVGLYGGFYPYKEGAVPSNPHIQSKIIPLQTDVSGQLNIQLKVAAQNN